MKTLIFKRGIGALMIAFLSLTLFASQAYAGGEDDYGSTVGYDNYYSDDYGSTVGYDNYYPDSYGSTVGYDNYYPDSYGSTVGYDNYYPDSYGSTVGYDNYYPDLNYPSYGCSTSCGSNYNTQPYQPQQYHPTTSYHPTTTYHPSSYPSCSYSCGTSCSYGCGSTPSYYPQPSYTSPSNYNSNYYTPTNTYHPTNTYTPTNTYNPTNTNNNVVTPVTTSGATSSSSANSSVNSSISSTNNNLNLSSNNISNTFNPTFNPTNNINNSNPINIVVNVPRGETATDSVSGLSAYCIAIPSNPQIGTTVTWQANASGGNGNYSYSWSGDVFGGGQSVTNTYYNAGNKNAIVTVSSNGRQVTASCSTYVQPQGSTIGAVSVYQQPQTPYGTPSAGVFLSQIPATGISPGLKMVLFVLGLFMWSAFGAYMILQKRNMSLAVAGMDGVMDSEMITDIESEDTSPVEESNPSEDLENNLSFRARENNILISRDGLAAIMDRSGNDSVAAEAMLTSVMSKVARNEGDYATLNSEKINQLLS